MNVRPALTVVPKAQAVQIVAGALNMALVCQALASGEAVLAAAPPRPASPVLKFAKVAPQQSRARRRAQRRHGRR